MIDIHQDLLTRKICGEGMPDFYSQPILDEGSHCYSPFWDDILKKLGKCKSMEDFGYSKPLPTEKECTSVMFYNYYGSAEFNTINRAFYQNTQGL